MRLFHVSEEDNIEVFEPRIPDREDLDKKTGLVWAIDEQRLPNYLTPRNCPRVTYHIGKKTSPEDIAKFFSAPVHTHAVIIEGGWFHDMNSATLYLYEFEDSDFVLQDENAGYYISTSAQIPKAKYVLTDLFSELVKRNVEIRMVDNLWDIAEQVKRSTLNWSLCRMAFARPMGIR